MGYFKKEWWRRRPKCASCESYQGVCNCENLKDTIGILAKKCVFKDWRTWFDYNEKKAKK